MQFELDRAKALITSINPAPEFAGEEKKPAGKMGLRLDLTNDSLAMFHPTLKHMLFCADQPANADLADQATTDDKFIRFQEIPTIHFAGESIGAKVTIHQGINEKSDIALELCTVDKFVIEPKNGGTVTISCRVQFYPDEKQAGKLWGLIGTNMDISIASPESAPI